MKPWRNRGVPQVGTDFRHYLPYLSTETVKKKSLIIRALPCACRD
jgi:hypothetical protein